MEADPPRRKICKVPDCGKNVSGRGFCTFHYHRWEAGIDVINGPKPREQIVMEKFKSLIPDKNGCLRWSGTVTSFGYARVYVNGKNWSAHRYFFTILKCEIPDGLFLDHLCRVRDCVNPDHLEIVTFAENINRGIRGDIKRSPHCAKGHLYDGKSPKSGQRTCSICAKERIIKFKNKKVSKKVEKARKDKRLKMERKRRSNKEYRDHQNMLQRKRAAKRRENG